MNVLFLMSDQLRWDAVSYARPQDDASRAFRTPHIDRLAKEGLSMRYSYSSTPTCTPARAAILTGRAPWNHGMLGYGDIAPVYPLEFPRVLSTVGKFDVVSIGKDHFGWNQTTSSGIPHGYQTTLLYDGLGQWDPTQNNSWNGEYDDYDSWFARQVPGKDPQATLDKLDGDGWNGWHGAPYLYDEYYHPTAWVGRNAVEYLEARRNHTTPFLAKVSFHRPHSPYDPPARLLDAVKESDLPPQNLCKAARPGAPSDDSGHGDGWCLRFRGGDGDAPGCDTAADAWCGVQSPAADVLLGRRAYAASVRFVDEWIGQIYQALEKCHLLESTWIIFTSDHGDAQGDLYHWRKGYPYEMSAHVPMLLRWPEQWLPPKPLQVTRGTTIQAPLVSELRDVFHTILDAVGLAQTVAASLNEDGEAFVAEDGAI